MEKLRKNIRLFGVLKIFTKRVFLPLTTIYLVEVGHVTIAQIGLLATISAIVSLASEIPTGYLADRLTRKSSLIAGGFFTALASLVYAFTPTFHGAILAVSIEALGYAFLNGPGEALIHDTLVQLKEIDNYPKVVGRAQSFGLIGNTILVILIPLTYSIDKRLPFLCGTVAYCLLMFVSSLFTEPVRPNNMQANANPFKDLYLNLRIFVIKASLGIFLAIGIIGGLYNTSSDFTNLIFKDLGLAPHLLGMVYGAASVTGIIGGYFIHHLRSIKLRTYALLDTAVFSLFILSIGITRNLWVAIIGFSINMGWWRLRAILYQYHLLRIFKKTAYKATLISTLAFFIRCNEVWLPFVFVGSVSAVGFYTGYIWIGTVSALILLPLFTYSASVLTRHFEEKI